MPSLQHQRPLSDAAVTVSIGVSGAGGRESFSAEELLTNAADALYHSKNGGRNRVSVTPSAAS